MLAQVFGRVPIHYSRKKRQAQVFLAHIALPEANKKRRALRDIQGECKSTISSAIPLSLKHGFGTGNFTARIF